MELALDLNIFAVAGPPELAFERCAAAGFRALDVRFPKERLSVEAGGEGDAWPARLRASAAAAGVHFVQLHGPQFRLRAGPEHDATSALCVRWLEVAAVLGVPWVVFEPGVVPGPYDAAHRRELLDGNVAVARRLLPVAERTGVGIALENLPDTEGIGRGGGRRYGAVPDELIELIDAVGHPLVGACWDTGHAHLQGLEQGRALLALAHRLKATHINDNDGKSDLHLLPYHGTVDWGAIMPALAAINYQGPFAYEVQKGLCSLPTSLWEAGLCYGAQLGRFLLEQSAGSS